MNLQNYKFWFSLGQGKYEQEYERSEEFQKQLKLKVRELLTEQEWRRRKMQMRVCWKRVHFPFCSLAILVSDFLSPLCHDFSCYVL